MEMGANFNIKGFVMDGEDYIGMVTDDGFTIQLQDNDGNVIPLNKERIEKVADKWNEIGMVNPVFPNELRDALERVENPPFVVAEDKVDEFLSEKPDEDFLKKVFEVADNFEKNCLPDGIVLEPEFIIKNDGSIKITGVSLVRKEDADERR